MSRPDARAGFTLIEVLAALAITGALVTVALPYAARLATRWWAGEVAVDAADRWMQALARLEDDVSQAVPLSVVKDGKRGAAFDLTTGVLQFVRPSLGQASGTELDTVRFEIRPSSSGMALVRRTRRFSAETFFAKADGGEAATLLEGPFDLRFFALGEDHQRRSSWSGTGEMPGAIELSVAATARAPGPPGPILLPVVAKALKAPAATDQGPGRAGDAHDVGSGNAGSNSPSAVFKP